MKVINIFGTPGSGKSSVAALLYHSLVEDGSVSIVSESTQNLVRTQGGIITQDNVFNIQKKKFEMDVDYIITDSPLLLSVIYDTRKNEEFNEKVLNEFLKYDNINIMLKRTVPYWSLNDVEYSSENDSLYIAMKEFFDFYNLEYYELNGDGSAVMEILKILEVPHELCW